MSAMWVLVEEVVMEDTVVQERSNDIQILE